MPLEVFFFEIYFFYLYPMMCVFSLTKLNGTKVVYKIVKNIIIYRLNTKIRLTMLCLSGFELYSRWMPLTDYHSRL